MEPNSPRKIQFTVPLLEPHLDPEAAEQAARLIRESSLGNAAGGALSYWVSGERGRGVSAVPTATAVPIAIAVPTATSVPTAATNPRKRQRRGRSGSGCDLGQGQRPQRKGRAPPLSPCRCPHAAVPTRFPRPDPEAPPDPGQPGPEQ
ncbi:protein phosphatase 1 regulatory subunit 1A-like [Pyrgilauda ruficollis]|uniref:protein phosphatase 1 regulatory subunit 1A-like n=1 Tax=Pyrgilauda ruficollis TaxID=221976 RepID=UPI001B86822D|nr:protein phosphatase 1 regulatory subunit 1A-like [Pyrgilauda ruficollis]